MDTESMDKYASYDKELNDMVKELYIFDIHDEFKKAICLTLINKGYCKSNQVNPIKCKCKRHPDSAFTVKIINEIPYCPRCGGIVWPNHKMAERDVPSVEDVRSILDGFNVNNSRDISMEIFDRITNPKPTLNAEEMVE